ncbi:protein kinase [Aureococcus anophagefferens]|nr:protein kinase [Aureococcus anophagefferens]
MASREIASSDDEPAAPRKGFKPTPEAPYRVVTPDVKDETRPPSPPPETPPANPKRPQPIKARSPVDNFLAWLSPRSSRESKWMQPSRSCSATSRRRPGAAVLRARGAAPGAHGPPERLRDHGLLDDARRASCLLLTWCASDVLRSLKLNDVADPETRHKVAKAWPAAERLRLVAELFGALAYLHSGDALRGVAVVHRDVKPENLGLTDARRLKLLDFGLAVALEKEDAAAFELTGDTGSLRYMAPEVAKQRPYAAPVDVYSAAIVSAEVLGLHRAFAGLSLEDHERRVIDGGLRPRLQASPRLKRSSRPLGRRRGKRRDAASARDELAAVVAADSDPRATPSCACVLS